EHHAPWPAIRALYERALACADRPALVLHSWGPSARTAEHHDEARDACRRGLALAPGDLDLLEAVGLAYYYDDAHGAVGAQPWFGDALARGSDRVMTRLYLAHCLHDQERWVEALAAYQAVDPARLDEETGGWQRWRILKWQEQIGLCLARLGRDDEARAAP